MNNEAVVLDKPAQIAAFRLACIIRGLDVELRTGMKVARNMPTLKVLRSQYGITATTKAAALEQLQALYFEAIGG